MSYVPSEIKEVEAANGSALDVVNVAISQIGYGAYNLNTKYASEVGYNYNNWCQYFVCWCMKHAGVPTSVYDWSYQYGFADYDPIRSGSFHYRGDGYTPKPGDTIHFLWNKDRGKYNWSHIGIVEKVSNGRVYTIEGNKENKDNSSYSYVGRCDYSLNESQIVGYGEVRYKTPNDTTKPVLKNVKITKRTSAGVTIECDATDNVGINRVEFPTWITSKTSKGCTWYKPSSKSGNHYVFNMNIKNFNNFRGNYTTHVYAWDDAGNKACYGLSYDILSCNSPSITFADVNEGKELKIKGSSTDSINYTILKNNVKYSSGTATGEYSTIIDQPGKYTVSAYSSRTNYGNSQTIKSETTLSKIGTPAIRSTMTENNILLDIESSTKEAAIYYTTNGTVPSTSSQKYTGAISVNSEKTIKAIAIKKGYISSDIMTYDAKLEEPSAPKGFSITDDCIVIDGKIATGKQVSVRWDATDNASSYTAELYKDGNRVKSSKTSDTIMSFTLDTPGKYQVHLYASNFVGNSEEAYPTVEVEAVAPSSVKFVDYDGKVIKEQKVAYGEKAVVPDDPERKGYTFVSWQNINKIESVTEDITVTATYKINTYSVWFYDASGKQVGSTQKVNFGSSAISPEKDLTDIPTGYVFAGWKVLESANDSLGDYTNVDSNLKLQAVYYWGNKDIPIHTEITTATRNSETGNYNVSVKLTNFPNEPTTAILRVSLLTKDGKMVKTGKSEVEIAADKSIEETVTLKYNGVASIASVVLLGLNGNDLTGSAYSKEVTKEITEQSDSTWSDWSEWGTEELTSSDDMEVEQKTQYRYREKQTTTSTAADLDGWTKYDSKISYGAWGAWSGYSPTVQKKSETRDVQTRTAWRYYYYYCPVCGRCEPLTGWSDCGKYQLSGANIHYDWFAYAYRFSGPKSFSYTSKVKYTDSLVGDGKTRCFAAGNLYSMDPGTKDANTGEVIIRTEYSYRTRTKTTTNYFYKWNNWSEWSENEVVANDNVEVETRTVYRKRTRVPVYSSLAGNEEEGKSYSFKGDLSSVDADLNGKLATILVYKGKNTDPNEDQIQYVGQTKIDSNNKYEFTVIPKTEPTDLTGDFTVCLGLEGSTGLVMVGTIKAPKSVYSVKYVDSDGNIISVQEVENGENAVVPDSPSMDGYVFVGWSANAMNVQSNMTISAIYSPLTYVVAFVDTANYVVSYDNYKYGDDIIPPTDPTAPGKTFKGWDVMLEGKTKVTGNIVANAVYDTETYVVTFVDDDNKTISRQLVEYGCSAMPPATLETAGKDFVGWSTNEEWWNVTKNMTVNPIFTYANTVEAPTYSFVENDDVLTLELNTTTSGADIYYMIAESKKTEEVQDNINGEDDGYIYSEPILYDGTPININNIDEETLEDEDGNIIYMAQTRIKTYAAHSGMNDSSVQKILYQQEYTAIDDAFDECTVKFDSNNGSTMVDNVRTIQVGDYISEFPIPERENYIFNGWTTDKEGENIFTNTEPIMEDIILYAQWELMDENDNITDNSAAENSTTEQLSKDQPLPAKQQQITEQEQSTEEESDSKTPALVPKIKLKSVKSIKKKQIKVSWKNKSNVSGYQISYSTSKKFKKAKIKNINSSVTGNKTIKGLSKGKKYYVRVRAYVKDSRGNKTYGKWSNVKSVKIKTK